MTNSASGLPGDPTVGQVASADRRHAMVDALVDRLILQGVAAHRGNRLADWLNTALRVSDAIQKSAQDDEVQLAVAVAGEAIRRISDLGVRNGHAGIPDHRCPSRISHTGVVLRCFFYRGHDSDVVMILHEAAGQVWRDGDDRELSVPQEDTDD